MCGCSMFRFVISMGLLHVQVCDQYGIVACSGGLVACSGL